MSSAATKIRFTAQEYLALERKSETRNEYYNGEIFAMAGASREHNLIVGNLLRDIGNQLEDRPCESYPSDMRVSIEATGLYTYPDVAVVCGEPRFQDREVDTLLNPTVIIEVLSPSTEAYDRGVKFRHYRAHPFAPRIRSGLSGPDDGRALHPPGERLGSFGHDRSGADPEAGIDRLPDPARPDLCQGQVPRGGT